MSGLCEASWENWKSEKIKSNWNIRLQRFQQERSPFRPTVDQVLTYLQLTLHEIWEKMVHGVRVAQALACPFLFCSLDQVISKLLIKFNILRSCKKILDIISLCSFCCICSSFHLPEESSCLYHRVTMVTHEHIQLVQLPLSWKES